MSQSIEKDSNAFEESLESVSGIKYIIKVMTYSIMLGGMVVLSLIINYMVKGKNL